MSTTLTNATLDTALTEARERYSAGNPKSLAAHVEATAVMPGANTRTVLVHGPFPLTIAGERDITPMESNRPGTVFDEMLETLAAIEHERWSHWQRHVHGKGEVQADGSILIPAELVRRWERQINTPYAALSDAEKESDREQVRKYLGVPGLADALKTRDGR